MEAQIELKLKASLSVLQLVIKDTSGGCGSAYELVVVAEEF
jgi:stress-induced morphogen